MTEVASLKERVIAEVDARRDELIRISDTIHAKPELAFEEFQSAALLSDTLEANGFAVERGVAGLPTAFVGEMRGLPGGSTVAFVAEYDALRGLGHACGHNIIGTAAVGAGLAMKTILPALAGTVRVVGAPAEEGGGGKAILVDGGVFSGVDAAMMVHPSKDTVVLYGRTSSAACAVKVEFFGRPAHAALRPEEGINALEAVLLTFGGINALRQHLRDDARIHGVISHGGEAPNIVPEYAACLLSIRAADSDHAGQILDRVRACAEGAARATGARLEFTVRATRYEPMMGNQGLAILARDNMLALGLPVPPLQYRHRGRGSSSDMGNVSQVVPSVHPYIAICDKGAHTAEFCAAAGSDAGHRALIAVAKTLAMIAVDLLADPQKMAEVKSEFGAGRGSQGTEEGR